MRIVVIGQGYVGLPLAMAAVSAGHSVVGFEIDEVKVNGLNLGRSHVDDVTDAELVRHLECGRYVASGDRLVLDGFDVAVITVPTPLTVDGNPDLSCVESAAAMLGGHVRPGATVILESTVYPGTTEQVVQPLLEAGSGLSATAGEFNLGFSPERIDPGNKRWTFTNTPKIVSGINETSLTSIDEFYRGLGVTTVRVSSPAEAELAKSWENTHRQVNIAMVNELARFASALGVDHRAALAAAATKPFGYTAFHPGPGTGGHCLPVDPAYLAWQSQNVLGKPFAFIELANEINRGQPDYVARRLTDALRARGIAVSGAEVAVLGYSYKPGTADCRETPAKRIVENLVSQGVRVTVFEPYADLVLLGSRTVRGVPTADDLSGADAVVIVTDHDEFDYDLVSRNARYLLDTRNRVRRSAHVEVI